MVPVLFPVFADTPKLLLVVMGLGLFTSARIAEQVRAGIQALPRGQRYAGMALGFTTPQYYRYVLLPMAFRIIVPPLTSEAMNIFKNSSVAFAVSITELTFLLGFSGQSALTRAFRRWTGASPTEYRSARQKRKPHAK